MANHVHPKDARPALVWKAAQAAQLEIKWFLTLPKLLHFADDGWEQPFVSIAEEAQRQVYISRWDPAHCFVRNCRCKLEAELIQVFSYVGREGDRDEATYVRHAPILAGATSQCYDDGRRGICSRP